MERPKSFNRKLLGAQAFDWRLLVDTYVGGPLGQLWCLFQMYFTMYCLYQFLIYTSNSYFRQDSKWNNLPGLHTNFNINKYLNYSKILLYCVLFDCKREKQTRWRVSSFTISHSAASDTTAAREAGMIKQNRGVFWRTTPPQPAQNSAVCRFPTKTPKLTYQWKADKVYCASDHT